jgi:hypothetical protein
LRGALGKHEEVIAVEVLRPGQAIRLEAIPPTTRKQRKAERRAARPSA